MYKTVYKITLTKASYYYIFASMELKYAKNLKKDSKGNYKSADIYLRAN
ncbi:unnamed protein product, partial [marine sediment metagenome]